MHARVLRLTTIPLLHDRPRPHHTHVMHSTRIPALGRSRPLRSSLALPLRATKRRRLESDEDPASHYQLRLAAEVAKQRRPPGEKKLLPRKVRTVLVLPHGQEYVQATNLRVPDGKLGLSIVKSGIDTSSSCLPPDFTFTTDYPPGDTDYDPGMDMGAISAARTHIYNRGRTSRRRASQWQRWNNVVIPSLIQPFLEYQRITKSGRLPSPVCEASPDSCICKNRRNLRITLVRLEGELKILLPSLSHSIFGSSNEL